MKKIFDDLVHACICAGAKEITVEHTDEFELAMNDFISEFETGMVILDYVNSYLEYSMKTITYKSITINLKRSKNTLIDNQ